MSAPLDRPRREYQLPTWPLPIAEYVPAFTRDETLHKKRQENVGTHATVLAMQSEGLLIGLRTLDELRDDDEMLAQWAQLQAGAMIGSAYHTFQWEGTPLAHRKLRLAELADDTGAFVNPVEFYQHARQGVIDVVERTDRVADNERVRGSISVDAYVRLAHRIGAAGAQVAVLPVRDFSEADRPVAVQQGAFDAVHDAWTNVLRIYADGAVKELPSIAQLADQDSPLRQFIRNPKSGLSDEVSEAVESAASDR